MDRHSKERNHGYGTEALKQMVQLIHRKHPGVKEVFINPEAANVRAVKCYQKAGFQYAGEMMDDGCRCLLLKINFEETSYGH